MAALPPAKNHGKTYYRLAWAIDGKQPNPFGERFESREAAQEKAPEINQQRAARGLVHANYVIELKFRAVRVRPRGRYVTGEIFPLPKSNVAKNPPTPSAPALTAEVTETQLPT